MPKKQRATEGTLARKAADLLAARPHFKKELRDKLVKRGYDKKEVDELIDSFEERGYLNDRDHALLYIEELKRKRFGKGEALRRLTIKGFPKAESEKLLKAFFLENDEIANIRYHLGKKKFNLDDVKEIKKAFDFLSRKGFSWDRIREVLKIENW